MVSNERGGLDDRIARADDAGPALAREPADTLLRRAKASRTDWREWPHKGATPSVKFAIEFSVLKRSAYSDHVVARLRDFFSGRVGWQRRLWDVGLVLSLRELGEASQAVQRNVLSAGAQSWLANAVQAAAGPDPGVARGLRGPLQRCVAAGLKNGSIDHRVLHQLTEDVDRDYLRNWADALSDPANRPGPERAARAIASHLMDAGLDPRYLYRWLDAHVDHKPESEYELHEIVALAHELVRLPPRRYEVVVGMRPLPGRASPPAQWQRAKEIVAWLAREGHDTSGLRLGGGLMLDVEARDPWSAVSIVSQQLERYQARVGIGTRTGVVDVIGMWVGGHADKRFDVRRYREVGVLALQREDQLFSETAASPVDAALELVAPLQDGPTASALAGGWAAIESTLVHPTDQENVVAADRLAAIVACSWPRAELTKLAHVHARQAADGLSERLNGVQENREKCGLVLDAIRAGDSLAVSDASDRAAVVRMENLVNDPRPVLRDVREHLTKTFRRFCRQRNLLLHGGQVGAVAAQAALRTASPIVGAGMDRLAHAWLVEGLPPLDLAARALLRLDLAGEAGGRALVDLLEP
jgi:hypothetical protein